MSSAQPLEGLRVVDLADGRGDLCGRLLADLGAEVIRVEHPDGARGRTAPPVHGGVSLWFAYRNAGKRSVALDVAAADDRERLHELLATADVWIDDAPTGSLDDLGLGPQALIERHPHLVALSMTDFGHTGPSAGYIGTDAVVAAVGGMVFKAGLPDREPLLPPGTLAYDSASITAAFAVLTALWQGRESGAGQHIDLSFIEATAQLADWSMSNASVQVEQGIVPNEVRAGSGPVYTILACADGYVRLVVLSTRQWHAMRSWLGEPEYLQDPELDGFMGRFGIADAVLNPLYEELFSTMPMAEVAAEAQRRGIVCTPLLTPAEVLTNGHFASRGTFVDLEVAPGVTGPVASGLAELDGVRHGPATGAPGIGADTDAVFADLGPARAAPAAVPEPALPLADLRVMDFGHGGVGVECARMLANYGADVLKIESRSYFDFIRTVLGGEMSPSFASSNQSKKGLGINAKTDRGRELLLELAAISDVAIENNSTGTMDGLGLAFSDLAAVNPGIVMMSSQLLGSRGEWAHWKGYGPNTQPVGGLVRLWDYPGGGRPAGSQSIYPDHLAGRIGAVVTMAGLLARHRRGAGVHAEVAQVEAITAMLGDLLLLEALDPGSVVAKGNRSDRGAPWGMYPCAGEQKWVAISVETDEQWGGLIAALGNPDWAAAEDLATAPGRHARAAELDERLGEWTVARDRYEVERELQSHGVPAGVMLTGSDQLADPHLVARGYPVRIEQPPLGHISLEGAAFRATGMAESIIGPAPGLGEHTRELVAELFGLSDAEIDALFEAGVLEGPLPVPEDPVPGS